MNRISIKSKITLWYTFIILLISILTLFVMVSVSREILMKDSADKLIKSVERIVPIVNNQREVAPRENASRENENNSPAPNGDLRRFPGFMFFENGVHTAVCNEDKEIIGGAIPFKFADEIELIDGELRERKFDGSEYLTYAKKILSQDNTPNWIIGVISIADESILLESVIKTNTILIAILLCVAALGGYLILTQAFKPVEKISSTAKLISESRDLSQRISLHKGKDEIHRLASTFDEMLAKIEKTLNKEKQFTSDASHELRTPVAVISSECEYTLECASTLEEAKESVASIKHQTDKMSKLISELLAMSRMDKNTMDINYENADISELLNFVCDEQEEIHKNGINLIRNITPNICCVTDSMLLARIFINLISNAYSYGKKDGNIEVSLLENDKEITFKVVDDGIGIAEENLPKIWERFYQVNPSRTNNDGSMGLGLSMVKLVADKLGGKLTVKSELGAGSTFALILQKTILERKQSKRL